MASPDQGEHGQLLGDESHKSPDRPTTPTPATESSPTARYSYTPSPRKRVGYARVPSVSTVLDEDLKKGMMDSADLARASVDSRDFTKSSQEPVGDSDDVRRPTQHSGSGLGIDVVTEDSSPKVRRVSIQAIKRVPVAGNRSASEQTTPGSADPLLSPPSTAGLSGFSGSTRYDSPTEQDTAYAGAKHFAKHSNASLNSTNQPSLYAKSDAGLMSMRSKYDDWEPIDNCRSHKQVKQKIGGYVSMTIILLAIFSTTFSAIYLVIGLRGPRYGRMIGTNGPLTASSAAFLTSFFAKLIEMSFVTVLVAFLGQALARRAYKEEAARGVTLAELSMRSWITQPGNLLTQLQAVRYAGFSVLGVIAMVAAVCAMLYTSAATALVQPQLKFPTWEPREMQGLVKTNFANTMYISDTCQTPIETSWDSEAPSTCISLEHASQGYHNYFKYINTWAETNLNGTGTSDLSSRPQGFALLTDNTTITAPFIEQYNTNMTGEYYWHDIIVNKVSMAMPHPGVIQAAQDQVNNIMQPAELDSLGAYNIIASVPSPVVHVLCVTMTQANMTPLVFSLWPEVQENGGYIDPTIWPAQLTYSDPFLNSTPYDDIFQWGTKYSEYAWPPVFPILPADYNTIVNDTTGVPYGRDSIYLLGKGGPTDDVGTDVEDENYALCQLKVTMTPNCSTHYNASSSGGTLEAVCEDKNDDMRYIKSMENATHGAFANSSKDWPNVASVWATSLALNDGIFEGNGTNSRLLTQLILTKPTLNTALPSIAEALAVMSGCSLLVSTIDAPFVEFWNYSENTISGQYQYFNASIRAQQYASGGSQAYQKAFFLILFTVCLMNLVVLIYFCVHRDWYTDFSEPTNLFSLAVNSPPSRLLAGSCGGGPVGEQLKVSWKLNRDGEHVYMESREVAADVAESSSTSPKSLLRRRKLSDSFEMMLSPIKKVGSNFERSRGR